MAVLCTLGSGITVLAYGEQALGLKPSPKGLEEAYQWEFVTNSVDLVISAILIFGIQKVLYDDFEWEMLVISET